MITLHEVYYQLKAIRSIRADFATFKPFLIGKINEAQLEKTEGHLLLVADFLEEKIHKPLKSIDERENACGALVSIILANSIGKQCNCEDCIEFLKENNGK